MRKSKKIKKFLIALAIISVVTLGFVFFDMTEADYSPVTVKSEATFYTKENLVVVYKENKSIQNKLVREEELNLKLLKKDTPKQDYNNYREVPLMVNPDMFVMPDNILNWQVRRIARWDSIVEYYLPENPELNLLLVLAVIGQESQGDRYLISDDGHDSVGLMQVTPQTWTATSAELKNPWINIEIGMSMLNQTIHDAREKYNFAPGLDSIRAGLAAYNCGWKSLLANRCYSFGGWAYADKVLLYWYPLLEERYQSSTP